MTTITLWLLVVVNSTSNNPTSGHIAVLERFQTATDCQHVLRSLPERGSGTARCIEARVVRL